MAVSVRHRLSAAFSAFRAAKPPTAERGYAGGPSSQGRRSHGTEVDENIKWRPPHRWATVRKMRSMPATNAAMDAIILSLLSTPLEITPGVDPDTGRPGALDNEIADFIWNDLTHLTQSLFDLRFEALDSALWNGTAPYQTVYSYDRGQGLYHLRKLAFRPPHTIMDWHADEHGGPDGVTQMDQDGQPVRFHMDELLVFVHRRIGGDLTGVPLSRRMYGPWYALDKLYKVAPVAVETQSRGIPVMKGRVGTNEENDRIDEILMGLGSGAYHHVRLSELQEMDDFKIQGREGAVVDPTPVMEFFRREIFLSTFTQGQVLGSDGVGARALGDVHMDMLMHLLAGISQMETATLNRYLIPPWVSFNWSDVPESRLPQLVQPEPDRRDVKEFMESLVLGSQAGVEWNREAVQRRAHDLMGTPLPDEVTTEQDAGAEELAEQEQARAGSYRAKKKLESEIALEALGIKPNFRKTAAALNEAERRILKAVSGVQRRQISNLMARAKAILKRREPLLVEETDMRFVDELEAELVAILEELYEEGSEALADELEQQGVTPPPIPEDRRERDRKLLLATAGTTAALMADRVKRAWSQETLDALRGANTLDGMRSTLEGLSDKTIIRHARQDSNIIFGLGRKGRARGARDDIDHFINSEVLDDRSCAACANADGVTVELDNEHLYEPFHDCAGGDLCRGQLVPVVKR